MIINSDFRDYYDFLLNHENRDPSIVYERKASTVCVYVPSTASNRRGTYDSRNNYPHLDEKLVLTLRLYLRDSEMYPREYARKYDVCSKELELILMAGKIYPFTRYRERSACYPYDSKGVVDYRTPYQHFEDLRMARAALFSATYRDDTYILKTPEFVMEEGFADPAAEHANKVLAPVIYVEGRFDSGLQLNLNPRLKDLNFPIHAAQVVQRLMQFMAPVDPQPVKTADKYRVQAHGFNKESFRREPGGPTRKRKKKHEE
jgi:hypothetical protein